MDEFKRVLPILEIINQYGIPLMEAGAKATGNPYDDLAVAFIKGGLPELVKKIQELVPDGEEKEG